MEKNISGLFIVFAVIFLVSVGVVYNIGVDNGRDSVVIPVSETCPEVVIPEAETIYIADASLYKTNAVADFLLAIDNEEVEDINGTEVDILGNYNFNELEISKIYDDYTVSYEDDLTIVTIKVKVKLDDGDTRVRQTYDVSVISEDSEDTIVIVA